MFTNLYTAQATTPMQRFDAIPVGTTFAFGPHQWKKFCSTHAERVDTYIYTHAEFAPADIVVVV